jgi:arylsulfatase A-like enzyme
MTKATAFLAAMIWAASVAAGVVAVPQKPNIVVILSDDAGYADFSMQGAKDFPTPNIDSIAASGVRFTSGYASAPVCSPSRAGLLTGRYQTRFGHELNIPPNYSESNGLPLSEKTIADAMKLAGYQTIALGKWHLGYAPKFHPLSRGFDDFYGFLQGSRSYFPLKKPTGLNRMLRDREPAKEDFTYTTDDLAAKAADYIRQNKGRPFFMYLAFNAVHAPFQALSSDLENVKGLDPHRATMSAMIRALDRGVGVVLNELKQQGLTGNTLVFFVNDNGGAHFPDYCNNHPLHGYKGSTWEGGIRVPFAVKWPGNIPAGKINDQPVLLLDIMPTAMAAAGVAKPPGHPLDGVNLLPFLAGHNKAAPHDALFWRYGKNYAARLGDWKLTDTDNSGVMLFNLAEDIGETHDLSQQEPGKLKELEAAYAKWNAGNVPAIKWGAKGKLDEDASVNKEADAYAYRMEDDP